MLFEVDKLDMYQLDARNNLRVWSIWQEGNEIVWEYGLVNGAKQRDHEIVERGKAGRTLQQQIESRINSRIQKQKLKGYKFSREEALKGRSNALGLIKPMLAVPVKKVKTIDFQTAFIQPKFDGGRLIITKQGGEIIAYSRNGKRITADISHIFDALDISEGTFLDGELYCHGESLQTIMSWTKRTQPNTKKLKYHLYDIALPTHYGERYEELRSVVKNTSTVEIAETLKIYSMEEALSYQRTKIEQGYEGAILRWGNFAYEPGKRSKSLLKIKSFEDDTFEVIDIKTNQDGWGICTCRTKFGTIFNVTAPGSYADKKEVGTNKAKYIGELLRVEFAYYTAEKKPFQPVATNFIGEI
jgi:DNA ligase-1